MLSETKVPAGPHLHQRLHSEKTIMKITCLGTGSPEPHKRRASSGYLIEIGDDRILFDCGGGVVDRLIQSGRLPSDITHLFFTHLHTDHMMDYARLVHAAWDEGAQPLKVFGPAPIAAITDRYFGSEGALAFDLVARTQLKGSQDVWRARGGTLPRPWPQPIVTEVEPGFTSTGKGWTLSSCSVPHAQPYLTCMAFKIEAGGKAFVFSGDAALCPDLESLSQDADLLIHWCYRRSSEVTYAFIVKTSPSADEIAAMAERAGVKQLLLTHIRKHMDTDAIHDELNSELSAHFSGSSAIAEDLMEIQL